MTELSSFSPVSPCTTEKYSKIINNLPIISSKSELTQHIQDLVPPGSPEPQDPQLIDVLKVLTQKLIAAYQADGSLHEDPFTEVWARSIHLYESEVRCCLVNQVVLVTGGDEW